MSKRFNLENISINYEGKYGREQTADINNKAETYDFVIVADSAFFYSTEKSPRSYRLLFPCFYEDQYILQKPSRVANKESSVIPFERALPPERLLVFPWSSANAQAESQKDLLTSCTQVYIEYADLVKIATDLQPPEAVVAWEPIASALIRERGLKKIEGTEYRVWISAYAHRKYVESPTSAETKFLRAFEEVFIASWNFCEGHREYAWSLVMQDLHLLTLIGLAAGLTPRPPARAVGLLRDAV
jgi:hypothetical protein